MVDTEQHLLLLTQTRVHAPGRGAVQCAVRVDRPAEELSASSAVLLEPCGALKWAFIVCPPSGTISPLATALG